MAIYSNFMRKIGPDGPLPAVFGASVDFGWAALVRGVDFRWVWPSGRAGLAVAWRGVADAGFVRGQRQPLRRCAPWFVGLVFAGRFGNARMMIIDASPSIAGTPALLKSPSLFHLTM
jgi:hypothetical protein